MLQKKVKIKELTVNLQHNIENMVNNSGNRHKSMLVAHIKCQILIINIEMLR